jgi:hypothetical protein
MTKRNYNEEMFHHIDNGYSMVKPDSTSVDISTGTLRLEGTIDEVDNSFWFEEDEYGGMGGVQIFGEALLSDDTGDTRFYFWLYFDLFGDPNDEKVIFSEIDRGRTTEEWFEYQIDGYGEPNEGFSDEEFEEIAYAIYDLVFPNMSGFGYTV